MGYINRHVIQIRVLTGGKQKSLVKVISTILWWPWRRDEKFNFSSRTPNAQRSCIRVRWPTRLSKDSHAVEIHGINNVIQASGMNNIASRTKVRRSSMDGQTRGLWAQAFNQILKTCRSVTSSFACDKLCLGGNVCGFSICWWTE